MIRKTSATLFTIFVLLAAPTFTSADVVKDMAKKVADAAFSEAERQVIEKYYEVTKPYRSTEKESDDKGEHDYVDAEDDKNKGKGKGKGKSKGKGKQKQKKMPKGIAMKLERGGAMPPGIAKTRLPDDLERQLPPPPTGFERIESEGKVILAEIATGVIADIIKIGKKSISKQTRE